MTLRIGDFRAWTFVGGAWADGGDEALVPTVDSREETGEGLQGYRYAFYRDLACRDLTARFRMLQAAHSDVGLIFRAQSPSRFHLLHFPCCGQACRAQHFWVALSEMDPGGCLRLMKLETPRRVNSLPQVWHEVEVEIRDDRLTARIDRRAAFEAAGLPARAGRLGAVLFNGARLQALQVEAAPVPSADWNETARPATNWFHPIPTDRFGRWQKPRHLLRTPGGDLLLEFEGVEGYGGRPEYYLTRSSDDGRTWSEPRAWFAKDDAWTGVQRVLHVFPDGRLRRLTFAEDLVRITVAETEDDARSWGGERSASIAGLPDGMRLHLGPQAFLNLSDGSTLLFLYGRHPSMAEDASVYTWSSYHCQAFAARSRDNGSTWTAPVNLDGARDPGSGRPVEGNLDLTEVCGAQTGDGSVLALIRPIHSAWMWEARSRDGGATWEPCVPGPFPGYAACNLLRTRAGVLLVAHRLPGLTVHTSRDDGLTWDPGTLIDSAIWAMGCMLEVEPDVVLYVYWDSFESRMRAQFLRVTPAGLQPARR